MSFESVRDLHAIAVEARVLMGKGEDEPRTNIRILPNGGVVVSLYSTCFSFIKNDVNTYTFPLTEIDSVIEKAKKEIKLVKEIGEYAHTKPKSLLQKQHVIPFLLCLNDVRRMFYLHVCNNHRKEHLKYNPTCNCFVTWEDLSTED